MHQAHKSRRWLGRLGALWVSILMVLSLWPAVALAMAIHAREKLGSVEPWSCETVDVLAGQRFSFDGF